MYFFISTGHIVFLFEMETVVPNTNVYVTNMPGTMTPKRFRQIFSTFGTIIGMRLVPRRKGQSPVGFVQYTQAEMAAMAITRCFSMGSFGGLRPDYRGCQDSPT